MELAIIVYGVQSMTVKSVLVVEDDSEIAGYLKEGLLRAGYTVSLVTSGVGAIRQLGQSTFTFILMDRMLPDGEGLNTLTKIRVVRPDTPIVVISAVSSVDERVKGLRFGADDYITKPFHISEVLARLSAIDRRFSRTETTSTVLRYADIELNLINQVALRRGKPIPLNKREFSILRCLMERPEQVVARRSLLKEVWNYDFDPGTNIVDVHISRIRSKLIIFGHEQLLKSVRGIGYILSSSDINDHGMAA